ncbi:glycosyltransferase [Mucilaginibacter sp. Bleaf8]|uniref:glycosyltransferase family 2 protein n=1 Tax=Mucilaginibacter sp. Bleaf8 TaxID=2834430 RepID=UPI001BCCA990|nr:glycosyltransferase [Mucilaginibacter sp. Bleaf8]MBS7566255.1 glycosyltransferase [Mucilaginibacter sp. Bleaf8]
MDVNGNTFKEVTLLITHYNRSRSLERLFKSFKDQGFTFGGIVVSDDCSKPEHLDYIKSLQGQYDFTLLSPPKNGGLGNNINKGQDAVKTPYTLYVQEDFDPKSSFADHLKDALSYMDTDKGLDIVRFYAYFKYPYLKPYGKGFSEMVFHLNPFYTNHIKFYVYSDHPHLRRTTFFEKFGRYPEGLNSDVTEYTMALQFIKHKGRGLFYDKFTELFDQKNSSDEPSTAVHRPNWRARQNPLVLAMRAVYVKVKLLKCTLDVMAGKPNA